MNRRYLLPVTAERDARSRATLVVTGS